MARFEATGYAFTRIIFGSFAVGAVIGYIAGRLA